MAGPFFGGDFFGGEFFSTTTVVVTGGGGGKRRKYKRPRYYSEVDYVPQPEMAVRQFDPINESAMEDEETDDELILFLARVLH